MENTAVFFCISGVDIEIQIKYSIDMEENKKLPKKTTMQGIKNMEIVKRFGEDFSSPGGALTLSASEVSDENFGDHNPPDDKLYSKTHPDGWVIEGVVHVDLLSWVNGFKATHPDLGVVEGDFEDEVKASSEEWDYEDI